MLKKFETNNEKYTADPKRVSQYKAGDTHESIPPAWELNLKGVN